jgi:hypothetical protein
MEIITPADLSLSSTDFILLFKNKNLKTAIKAPNNIAILERSITSAVNLFSRVPNTLTNHEESRNPNPLKRGYKRFMDIIKKRN